MSFITTARAIDDDRFTWRVRAAAITVAARHINGEDGTAKAFAELIFQNPMSPNRPLEALVAANPAISETVTVDDNGTVNTELVPDGDIEFVITDLWLTAARIHKVGT